MNNIKTIEIKTIDDVYGLILVKYKTLRNFCSASNLPYNTLSMVMHKKNMKHRHARTICEILEIDINQIEVWKDL